MKIKVKEGDTKSVLELLKHEVKGALTFRCTCHEEAVYLSEQESIMMDECKDVECLAERLSSIDNWEKLERLSEIDAGLRMVSKVESLANCVSRTH